MRLTCNELVLFGTIYPILHLMNLVNRGYVITGFLLICASHSSHFYQPSSPAARKIPVRINELDGSVNQQQQMEFL
uniref:CSON012174 protein n=1 Tax=Culicoides sonorensis TaxID=179676 RepID=A0A336LM02_CULSO